MQNQLDEVRELERHLADLITNVASPRCERAQRRVKQLEMALASDLFMEFEELHVYRLRELAASVRVKHALVTKEYEDARRIADECDEAVTICETAGQLGDDGGREKAQERLGELVERVRDIHSRTVVVCDLLGEQENDQATTFERMRR